MEDIKVFTVTVPRESIIRQYGTCAVYKMPNNCGFDNYRFMLDNHNQKEIDENTYELTINRDIPIRRRGKEVRLSAEEFAKILTANTDYTVSYFSINVPIKRVAGQWPNMIRVKFPKNTKYVSKHIVIPSIFKDEKNSTDDELKFRVPDYMNFSMTNYECEDVLVSAEEIAEMMAN